MSSNFCGELSADVVWFSRQVPVEIRDISQRYGILPSGSISAIEETLYKASH
jgi:hypothetical protein